MATTGRSTAWQISRRVWWGRGMGIRLGGGGKHGPYAQVVRPVCSGLQSLLHRVGRNAHQQLIPGDAPHLPGAEVLLPHMDSVCTAGQGKLDIIVDDKGHPVLSAELGHLPGFLQQQAGVGVLFPQLDTGDPAFQGLFHLPQQRMLPRPGPAGHGIEQHMVLIAFHTLHLLPILRVLGDRSYR